ncbi:MAG: glycosyltransferase [bacterium]
MTWLLLLILFLILLINCGLLLSVLSIRTHPDSIVPHLKISVVIAAKNEERNIPGLISSLKNIDYSMDLFEVIIVDDNSTDNTFTSLAGSISQNENIKYFRLPKENAAGKKNALTFGISKSSHDCILITDADCNPSPGWIKSFAKKFYDGNELVFGVAPYRQSKGILNKIICFENLRAHILTFGAAKTGFAYSGAARSLGFRKEFFIKIGGYAATNELKSGDDDLLIREVIRNKLKIGVVADESAFVFTESKSVISEYFSQKSRHTSTSNYYLFRHKLFLSVWHFSNILIIFSPLLLWFSYYSFFILAAKLLMDFLIVLILQKKFSYAFKIHEILLLQITYELLLIVHYINSIHGKKRVWK